MSAYNLHDNCKYQTLLYMQRKVKYTSYLEKGERTNKRNSIFLQNKLLFWISVKFNSIFLQL